MIPFKKKIIYLLIPSDNSKVTQFEIAETPHTEDKRS